jgi:hypothetical protein
VSPVRGDAWSPVAMAPCAVERPAAERVEATAVCNVSEARASVVKRSAERRGRDGAEFPHGEGQVLPPAAGPRRSMRSSAGLGGSVRHRPPPTRRRARCHRDLPRRDGDARDRSRRQPVPERIHQARSPSARSRSFRPAEIEGPLNSASELGDLSGIERATDPFYDEIAKRSPRSANSAMTRPSTRGRWSVARCIDARCVCCPSRSCNTSARPGHRLVARRNR